MELRSYWTYKAAYQSEMKSSNIATTNKAAYQSEMLLGIQSKMELECY